MKMATFRPLSLFFTTCLVLEVPFSGRVKKELRKHPFGELKASFFLIGVEFHRWFFLPRRTG